MFSGYVVIMFINEYYVVVTNFQAVGSINYFAIYLMSKGCYQHMLLLTQESCIIEYPSQLSKKLSFVSLACTLAWIELSANYICYSRELDICTGREQTWSVCSQHEYEYE